MASARACCLQPFRSGLCNQKIGSVCLCVLRLRRWFKFSSPLPILQTSLFLVLPASPLSQLSYTYIFLGGSGTLDLSFHIQLCPYNIMPSILQSLALVLAAASLPTIHARPLHSDPASPSVHTDGEPASLLGRQYLHLHENQKRVPLILMDPALNQGMETPNMKPSSLPPPSTVNSPKKAKKVKSREQPMPFAQYLNGASDDLIEGRSSHRRGETHPVSYLSNVNPAPPPPAPAVQAPTPPAPPAVSYPQYRPYESGSDSKSSKKKGDKKDEDKSKSKAKSMKENKRKGKA